MHTAQELDCSVSRGKCQNEHSYMCPFTTQKHKDFIIFQKIYDFAVKENLSELQDCVKRLLDRCVTMI